MDRFTIFGVTTYFSCDITNAADVMDEGYQLTCNALAIMGVLVGIFQILGLFLSIFPQATTYVRFVFANFRWLKSL